MTGWIRTHEARMPFSGLSPLRSLVLAGVAVGLLQAALLAHLGAVDAAGSVALFLSTMSPRSLVGGFLPALCLVPLAARMRPAAIVALYVVAGVAMPLLSHWADHPYALGILPGPFAIDLAGWLSGVPMVAYGVALALIGRGEDRVEPSWAPLRAFGWSMFALASVGLPATFLWGGGRPDVAGVLAVGALMAGLLKTALLGGPCSGLAAYVLSRGLPAQAAAAAYVAAGYLAIPNDAASFPAVWWAGFLTFGAAVLLNGRPARRPVAARPAPLPGTA